jgi:CBS domain-containing protein
MRQAIEGISVREVMQTLVVAVSPDVTLEELVDRYVNTYRFSSFPVTEDGRLTGAVSIDDVQAVPRADWPVRRVRDVMQPLGEADTVRSDEDLAGVFRKMLESDRGHLPVVDDGRLVGLVTRNDVLNLLKVRTGT